MTSNNIEEKSLWNQIINEKNINFFIELEHVFFILEKLQPMQPDISYHYESFLYKGISIKVPIEVYYKLCILRFEQTNIGDEKYYFANCAMRAFNKTKFKKLRDVYNDKTIRATEGALFRLNIIMINMKTSAGKKEFFILMLCEH